MTAMSLLLFALSLLYTILIFIKIARPSINVVIAYVFFFPYSLFNLVVLGASAVQAVIRPKRQNKWET
jgi:hypothetical protein